MHLQVASIEILLFQGGKISETSIIKNLTSGEIFFLYFIFSIRNSIAVKSILRIELARYKKHYLEPINILLVFDSFYLLGFIKCVVTLK